MFCNNFINSFNPFASFFTSNLFGNNYFNRNYFNNNYNFNNYYPIYNNSSVFQNYSINSNNIKGKTLFQNALAGIPAEAPNPPMCAKYVKNAIVRTGLGQYMLGNGEQTKYMLRSNPNFMEVKVDGDKLKYLPEGTVITYDAFDSGVGKDGHVVIKGPNETAVSDRFENFIIPSDKAHVFLLA